jgi:polyisoprenoid-binding protein YceI
MNPRARLALVALLAISSRSVVVAGAGPWTFVVDPAASSVSIHVGKAGVLGFAGHIHEVVAPALSGTVTVYSDADRLYEVSLMIDAAALRIADKSELPNVAAEIQRNMLGPRVLDVAKYPAISYRYRRIAGPVSKSGDGARLDGFEGDLTLHGVTRRVGCTVTYSLQNDVRTLTARGEFKIKQTDFGIAPVTAAGGTIRVRDELEVSFAIVARRPAGHPVSAFDALTAAWSELQGHDRSRR